MTTNVNGQEGVSAGAADDGKDGVQQLIEWYYVQLTEGCGASNCKNEWCRSSPACKAYEPDDAAVSAFELAAGGGQHLCERGAPRSLSLGELEAAVELAKETKDIAPLVKRITGTFVSADVLGRSFLPDSVPPEGRGPTEAEAAVDYAVLDKAYRLVTGMGSPQVMYAVTSATQQQLEEEASAEAGGGAGPASLLQLRSYLIILQNPLLLDPDYHRPILQKLCKAVNRLVAPSRDVFLAWCIGMPREAFAQAVTVLQHYITVYIYSAQRIDESVIAPTKTLSLLQAANDRGLLVPHTEFYNDAINQELDVKEDYKRWKNPHKYDFSFCNYPFILDAGTKSKILQQDANDQMSKELQAALWRNFTCPFLELNIRREQLIKDATTEICRKPEDLKKPLKVHFVGEEGIDEGGVQKEFFQLIVRQTFDPKFGMFTYNEELRAFWFNSSSLENEREFKLVGIILGVAIYNGVILDVHFPPVVYKKLMRLPLALEDLRDFNPPLHRGLSHLLEFTGDCEETFCQSFEVTYEAFGEMRTHELLPGGAQMPVRNDNRQEYVDLYVEWLLETSIAAQFDAFAGGFWMVCGGSAFDLFRPEELELLVCGAPQLDFDALERATICDDGYTSGHRVIRDFWEVVHAMTTEQKKKLLFFTTGSDRVPIKGLSNLTFIITRNGPDSERLPTAHTCFNHLLLPEYDSKEKLRERLLTAINNAEGFGLM